MDRDQLEAALVERYDAEPDTARVVARQAQDLADSGLVAEEFGYALSADDVLDRLSDAPEPTSVVDRWNWWIEELELPETGQDRFRVRQDVG